VSGAHAVLAALIVCQAAFALWSGRFVRRLGAEHERMRRALLIAGERFVYIGLAASGGATSDHIATEVERAMQDVTREMNGGDA
jgi:hypothetical protein